MIADSRSRGLVGDHEVVFTLWDAEIDGVALWSETRTVTFDKGFFSEYLGSDTNPIDLSWFADDDAVYLHVAVDGDDELARIRIGTSPYAAYAQYCGDASTLMGAAPGDFLYTAGAGLSLAGNEFSVSQSSVEEWARGVAYDSVAELRSSLDTVYLASSYQPSWSALTGIPADLADGDDGQSYTAGAGLSLASGAFSLDASGCQVGYVLMRNNTNDGWTCVAVDYTQVTNPPDLTVFVLASELATVATSGAYADLTGKPDLSVYAETSDLAAVASSGAYSDLSGTPSLATVATSGAYTDLTGKPSLATVATSGAYADLTGKPSLATVATSGAYADLTGKPDLSVYAETSDLAVVASSGAYSDLSGTPSLATVATSGAYADLTGKPSLATVATTGSYNDLLDKPAGGGGSGVSAFGDGTAGGLTISTNTNWSTSPPTSNNFQFASLTINAGITLTVASGTVIRCTGTFTNNGTVVVLPGSDVSNGHEGDRGLSKTSPYGSFNDEYGDELVGKALSSGEALTITRPPREAGGSGGWGWNAGTGAGDGGGSLVIRAASGVDNAGTIRANGGAGQVVAGATGNGGGAGGFLIIASAGTITNSGTIQANGGAGANPSGVTNGGAGGGGGGGIIHVMGPNASSVAGTIQVSGGAAGTNAGTGTGTWGGPGGGLGGNGGRAGDGTGAAATAGSAGIILRSQVNDPSALFF